MQQYKEIPSGVIDWVNKVFTFINEIDYIDDLWVDNVIYNNYSINWNIVTLNDAPTLAIYADYNPKWSVIPVATDVTYWDIKSKVWQLLGQKPTSTNFSNEIVWDEINVSSLDIWRGRLTNLLNQQIIRAWNLWFQEWYFTTRIKSGWIATEVVNIWDWTIKTDTTNFYSPWVAMIWWDIFTYTWKTATELTWVTGITTNHYVWDKITQLYQVPTNFETMILTEYVKTNCNGVYYQEIPLNNGVIRYQIMRMGANVYLKIDWFQNNTEIRIKYTKKYEDMVNDTDICPYPDKYGTNVIAYVVAWALAYDKWMPQAERLLNRGYANLKAMYQYYTNETKVIKQRLQPKHYSFNRR